MESDHIKKLVYNAKIHNVFAILIIIGVIVSITLISRTNTTERNEKNSEGNEKKHKTEYKEYKTEYSNCNKHFYLSEKIVASVCPLKNQSQTTELDIRLFLNDKPTYKGIKLNRAEFFSFHNLFEDIRFYMDEETD